MPTYTALVTLPGKEPAERLASAMERLEPTPVGLGVFEVEDGSGLWEVGAYFESRPDPAGLALVSAAFGVGDIVVSEVPETDWVSHVRRELHPVEAGRFFVHGSHDADRVPAGRIPLLIEAAMAFGTGHHGTTLGCLTEFDALTDTGFRPDCVLDVGCGTAVLAMAAARAFPEARVFASDIDPVAVEVADTNIRANGLDGRITCLEAEGVDHADLNQAAPFDLVFANILKGPLVQLAPDLTTAVAPGGALILSGLLVTQAEEVATVYSRLGFNLSSRRDIVDWSTLNFRKSRPK